MFPRLPFLQKHRAPGSVKTQAPGMGREPDVSA